MTQNEWLEDDGSYAERREQLAPLIVGLYKDLSAKERQVLSLMQQDLSEADIMKKLRLSRWAVRTYRARIQAKVKKLLKDDTGILLKQDGKIRF